MDIASEIRAEAARQHLSQRKLAELMGAPRTTVNKKIIGERKITGVDLESFSRALNIPAWELVRRAEEAAEKKASRAMSAHITVHNTPGQIRDFRKIGKPLVTDQRLKGATA